MCGQEVDQSYNVVFNAFFFFLSEAITYIVPATRKINYKLIQFLSL